MKSNLVFILLLILPFNILALTEEEDTIKKEIEEEARKKEIYESTILIESFFKEKNEIIKEINNEILSSNIKFKKTFKESQKKHKILFNNAKKELSNKNMKLKKLNKKIEKITKKEVYPSQINFNKEIISIFKNNLNCFENIKSNNKTEMIKEITDCKFSINTNIENLLLKKIHLKNL